LDLTVNGPKVYVRIEWLYQKFAGSIADIFGNFGNIVTQTTVSLFVVTIILLIMAKLATRNLGKRPGGLQVIVEKLVNMLYGLVEDTMGKHNAKFAPYIGTLFLSSIVGSLIGTTAIFRSATGDLSVTLAWALVTTGMVWYNNIKNFGFKAWLKGFTEPIVVMTPMNIVSEIAQPLSMAFRHFGNVAGGGVITSIIYAALSAASAGVLNLIASCGWLVAAIMIALGAVLIVLWAKKRKVVALVFGIISAVLGIFGLLQALNILVDVPILTYGIPAVLSCYFDLFSGFVQAYVFSLLTMVYIAGSLPEPQAAEEK
jgi:F-type H+-transporting ATPase subunit a